MAKALETVREAAASTGIPQSRLYELVAKARANPDDPMNIPFVPIESRIYFRSGALEEWIGRLEVAPRKEPQSAGRDKIDRRSKHGRPRAAWSDAGTGNFTRKVVS
jgi:hypothetical protein